uniref:Uncharacterized protein n=1 Tax=Klebsiella phage FKP3 TaxID=3231233 RepID=A0AAU8I038_9CAUD
MNVWASLLALCYTCLLQTDVAHVQRPFIFILHLQKVIR